MRLARAVTLVALVATPLSFAGMATAAPDSATDTKTTTTSMDKTKPMASAAEIKAKEADCSRQADRKKLHGDARLKFRAECKKK